MREDTYQQVLHEFRADVFQRLTLIIAIFSIALGVLLVNADPLPHQFILTLQIFGAFVFYIRSIADARPTTARSLFVISLYGVVGLAMLMLRLTWLPFIVAPLLFVSELLIAYASLIAGGLFLAYAALLVHMGYADYPLQGLVLFVLFVIVLSRSTLKTVWVLLNWYLYTFGKSNLLLEETRLHRAELLRTLKSLEIARETQQRLQSQLAYAQQQADEARKMKERFASNISHELRTPLNIIVGFTEIMHVSPEVYGSVNFPPKLQQDIYQIHRNSRHLLDMIDDVLDLAHIEMTQFSLNFERTDLAKFLQDTTQLVSQLFKGKPVEFVVEIADNLPEIQIDRTRIRQVIINLLNNAQRFTAAGSVTFSVYADEKNVVFQVADTGIGIPKDQLQLIFEEFFQVDYSLSRSTGGAGLGLAITRRFVEAHNGHLRVESEEGVGSTFTFTLPLPTPTYAISPVRKSVEVALETLWLVIDADPYISKLILRHTQGCSIIPIENPDQLEDAIRRYSPQGIIFNNPWDMAIPACLNDSTLPVVICSLPSTTQLVAKLGVNACLAKPILPQQLVQHLEPYPSAKTILVIDDDIGVVQLVQRTVENRFPDLIVQRAYDGLQACEMMKLSAPDLILLDLVMPTMSGFEVINTLKASPQLRDIPVILLTASKYIHADNEMYGDLRIHRDGGLKPTEVLKLLNLIAQSTSQWSS
ncbi:MAG: hybrid sensor histidine kinase/response regulator [Chloroflexota bacterium]